MILPLAFAAFLILVALRRPKMNDSEDEVCHMPCLLLEMPGEILERMLDHLDPEGLVAASQTCRTLRDTAKSPRLTYRYALAMRGYVNVPNRVPPPQPLPAEGDDVETSPHTGTKRVSIPSVALARWPDKAPPKVDVSALSAAEKGRLLRDREERFDRLAPAQVREFAVAGPAGVYELQDGVFLLCHERSTSHSVRPTKIRLIPLASSTDPDLDRPILPCKVVDMGFSIADLTMDPSQDLIVVSEHDPSSTDDGPPPIHRFHLLTLSDAKPHPLAAKPILDSPPWCSTEVRHLSQQLLQVMDSTLLILIAVQDEGMALRGAYHEEMFAWNWKTGEVLGRRNLGETLARSSMALLTPTTVAVTMPAVIGPTLREMFGGVPGFMDNRSPIFIHEPSIDIFSFARRPDLPIRENYPLKRHDVDKETPRFALLASLLLPPMRSGSMMAVFHMRPDPAFPAVPTSQATLGSRPFTQDPRRGVIVIELAMDDDRLVMPMRMRPEFYEMFILRETLVDMAEEGEERLFEIWARRAVAREAGVALPQTPSSTQGTPLRARSTSPISLVSSSLSGSRSPSSPRTPSSGSSSIASPVRNRGRSYAAKPRRKHNVDSPTRTYEWDEWGEHSARVMLPTQRMRRLWVCSCSGYRYASLVRTRTGLETFTTELNVLDFNPRWFAKDKLRPEPEAGFAGAAEAEEWEEEEKHDAAHDLAFEGCTIKSMDRATPSVIKSEIWDDDVISRLPFRSVTRKLRNNPKGVMIDDQRIMIVEHSIHDNDWLGMIQYISTWCM